MDPLTPAQIRERTFTEVRRGADPAEVAAFLGQVSQDMDTLTAEVYRLRARQPDGDGEVEVQAVTILARAQQNADRVIADAQDLARSLAADGRARRDEAMADGYARAEAVMRSSLDEAAREAARITSAAPIDAQRRMAYYQALASSIRTQLDAFTAALTAGIAQWEADEQAGARELLDGPVPGHRART